MELVWQGLIKAIEMLIQLDPEILSITWLTLSVALSSILISVVIGLPIGVLLGLTIFTREKNTRHADQHWNGSTSSCRWSVDYDVTLASRPLGKYALLYTPYAMVMAQVLVSLADCDRVNLRCISADR